MCFGGRVTSLFVRPNDSFKNPCCWCCNAHALGTSFPKAKESEKINRERGAGENCFGRFPNEVQEQRVLIEALNDKDISRNEGLLIKGPFRRNRWSSNKKYIHCDSISFLVCSKLLNF